MHRTLATTSSIAVAVLLAACGQPAGGPPPMPPAQVNIVTVQPTDVPVTYEYVAQTAGFREVEVRARVQGIMQKRNYLEGSVVKQGDSLFTIDPAPFRVAVERAEADMGVAQARAEQAKRDMTRLKPVFEAKAASQKDYDDAVSAANIAAAELKSAQARLNEAKLNLDYTRVEAPITGVASRAVASEGTLVSGPNVLLTTVTQVDPMYVIFGIPDRDNLAIRQDVEAGRLKHPAGKFRASVKLSDGSAYKATGALGFTDVRVNTQTGTSEARAQFPNPNGVLRAGEFVRILLQGAIRPGAMVVPQRAVLEGPKGKFVYIVNADNKAEPRPVEVGGWSGDGWVVGKGLQAGDRVIVDGVMKIGPGAPVQVGAPADGKAPQGAPDKGAQKSAVKS